MEFGQWSTRLSHRIQSISLENLEQENDLKLRNEKSIREIPNFYRRILTENSMKMTASKSMKFFQGQLGSIIERKLRREYVAADVQEREIFEDKSLISILAPSLIEYLVQ